MDPAHQLSIHDDRRKYPRMKISLPVKVRGHTGKPVKALIYDLSPEGLQIRCDKETANSIHPIDKNIDEGKKPAVVIAFTIPHHKGEREIIIRCKICHFVLLDHESKNEVAFGLRFTKFKDNCDKYISQFFVDEMEPSF